MRRAKWSGRLPSATPLVEPWFPAKPRAGSWQLAQLVPGGSERPMSEKICAPIDASCGDSPAASGAAGLTAMGALRARRLPNAATLASVAMIPSTVTLEPRGSFTGLVPPPS